MEVEREQEQTRGEAVARLPRKLARVKRNRGRL